MTTVKFHLATGSTMECEAAGEANLMQLALNNGVPGIVGECGGSLMCSTCHVYLDHPADTDGPGAEEDEMLDFTEAARTPASRLSCQLVPHSHAGTWEVRVPEAQ